MKIENQGKLIRSNIKDRLEKNNTGSKISFRKKIVGENS